MGLLGAAYEWGGGGGGAVESRVGPPPPGGGVKKASPPPPRNLSPISYNDKTWHSYTLPQKDLKKKYKSCDRHLEFYQKFLLIKFCCITKYRCRLHFDV